jgi:hypothetical protein
MNLYVYNATNVIGILLTSLGVGFIDWRYGLICAGLMLIALNIHTLRTAKGQ